MKVIGTAVINFEVDLDVEDISEDSMSLYDSDLLIARAIDEKLPAGFFVDKDITVKKTIKD